ncbi:universal stress protein [Chitinivorax sp. B]|uniref:universal stress protein n=1 Tax=Chitinivorax sp. B TaxID=2502235 RepID=UPI0014852D46|nr:universal stress protein [Chitinivorax sp. B]
MQKILVAMDGSPSAMRALDAVLGWLDQWKQPPEIHLVNVQYPLHGEVASFIDAGQIKQYHQDEGGKALAVAVAKLSQAGVVHTEKVLVGRPEEVLVRYAKDHHCDQIVMGAQGVGSLTSMLLGSVAIKLLHLSECPVLLVR